MTTTTIPDVILDGVRALAADVESVDADEGTILMRAAPYNREAQLAPRIFESFAPGTFARAADAPQRVKMFHEHSTHPRGRLIGHALQVDDLPDGVWIKAKFSNTVHGQEARELARDGTLDQVSVEFRAMPDWIKAETRPDGVHYRHARAHLKGVALVPHGAYAEEAHVVAVRNDDPDSAAAEEAERRRREIVEALRALTR